MKLHIRCNGESHTLDADHYGITRNTSDQSIKSLVSEIYSFSPGMFKDLVVDRNPDGIVVRPPAVFG
jgi:hypothetical protein